MAYKRLSCNSYLITFLIVAFPSWCHHIDHAKLLPLAYDYTVTLSSGYNYRQLSSNCQSQLGINPHQDVQPTRCLGYSLSTNRQATIGCVLSYLFTFPSSIFIWTVIRRKPRHH